MEKLIITVAPTKKDNPSVPIRPDEIIQAGILCKKAGTSIIHIHARNPVNEIASTDFQIFQEIYKGLSRETNQILSHVYVITTGHT